MVFLNNIISGPSVPPPYQQPNTGNPNPPPPSPPFAGNDNPALKANRPIPRTGAQAIQAAEVSDVVEKGFRCARRR